MIPAMTPAPRRWFMSWLALAILAVVLVGEWNRLGPQRSVVQAIG